MDPEAPLGSALFLVVAVIALELEPTNKDAISVQNCVPRGATSLCG